MNMYFVFFFAGKKPTNGTEIDKVEIGEGPIGQGQKEETGSHMLPTESVTGAKRPRKPKPSKQKKTVQQHILGAAEGDPCGTFGRCTTCFHIPYQFQI